MAVSRAVVATAVMISSSHGKYMDCNGSPLCGLLVLESGQGAGNYNHKEPAVHGLWPQTGQYGSSQCIKPKDTSGTKELPLCYNIAEAKEDPKHQVEFVAHEWTKHGTCAGADGVADFFGQVCSLANAPLAVMGHVKENGGSFNDIVQAVKMAGYPVFEQDGNEYQIQLSACAGSDQRWKLANTTDFSTVCGALPKQGSNETQMSAAVLV